VSWTIGYQQGKRLHRANDKQLLFLTTLATAAEERGFCELVRDKKGDITGGRNITITPGTGAGLISGNASLSGSGTVSRSP
jgi:hypothetical protein